MAIRFADPPARAGAKSRDHDEVLSLTEALPQSVRHVGFAAPGRVEIFQYDEPDLPEGCFRVRTLYSGICASTELPQFEGTSPYLHARWDEDLKLFEPDGRAAYPVPFAGYMQSGLVVATRTDAVREGEIVGMSYGHKTSHTARVRDTLFFTLPDDMEPILGIYAAQMGPTCANGILHADEEAYGENAQVFGAGVRGRCVLVCGTGVTGLLTAMMCRWAGAAEVAIAGRNAWKLSVAAQLGLIPLNIEQVDVGCWAKERWHDGAGQRGAEVAFQCSGSDELLNQALRALRPQCAVIDLGFHLRGAQNVVFGREFYHNGLKHISAQVTRVPRKLSAQWDRRRLAATTLDFLSAEGETVRERLFTHVFPFERAQDAYDTLANEGEHVLQAVLRCD